MRIVLVDMPWSAIDAPSLALGILKRRVLDVFPDARIDVVHANLDYVDWLTARTGFTFEEYDFCASSYFSGHSEWIFSAALNEQPGWHPEFGGSLGSRVPEPLLAKARELHRLAPLFVGETAARITAGGPDVVGFTTTFAQNAAALATARAVKVRAPRAVTVFGGANCDGPQGAALHRNFPFVDFVVRGEGEAAFPQLLAALRDGGEFAGISGLCWRDTGGRCVTNPMEAKPLPPAALVTPEYGDYFDRHARSTAGSWVEPRIVVEGSRGCWWGEKHHCTFCGLNGSFMEFRSKNPQRFVDEILGLVERYRILDVWVTDNILDMAYLTSMAPRLQESGYDLRLCYEIKSNLRREQLRTLSAAGIGYIQAGVENLSSRVLKLMDKGVTGCQNVRLLRDAETVGMNLNWNYLYGFPGESEEDYDEVCDQVPALHHLTPPFNATRLKVERFSPYFDRPELGFDNLRPASHYHHIYDLPDSELADLVYLFDSPKRGIPPSCLDRLKQAVSGWKDAYVHCRLTHCDLGDHIVLVDTRPGFTWHLLDLTDPLETTVFRLLDMPHSPASLLRKAAARHADATENRIGELLARWRRLGLVFTDGGQYIHIAPAVANQDLMRLDGSHLHSAEPLAPALAAAGGIR
ncbi:B12-binding domain-containing radical SAM protein [Streptomyces sp. CB02923]|uniref:RiPP maturation radical SAM C-methyltransferase n=1 Tax=Streptomyces sp. CB02923 TaxID=1718985 RepID=UPI00093BFAAB|nr:RiPP maturation radical SAM C-methyltransferase [Streptomyces sp. CB02923]OKI02315.1 B12-binding domain-containing radical SAM protein [Streptomyces sp. CB02923]